MPKIGEQYIVSSDNLEFSWPPQSSTGAFSSDMTECGDTVHYKVFLMYRILTYNKTNLRTS